MLLFWACNNQRRTCFVPNPRLASTSAHEIDSANKELSSRIELAEIQIKRLKKSEKFIKQGPLITETSADPVHQ